MTTAEEKEPIDPASCIHQTFGLNTKGRMACSRCGTELDPEKYANGPAEAHRLQMSSFAINSGISAMTGAGFVTIEAISKEEEVIVMGQFTPAELRDHALACMEAAEAAESDAIVLKLLTTEVEMSVADAAVFIQAIRDLRGPRPARGDS